MRKFTLVTIAFISIAFASNAQIQKGSILLGGNISASSSNSHFDGNPTDTESEGFNVSPSVGFVTATNTAWGFNLSYANGKTKYLTTNNNNENKTNGYGGGIFYRRYVTLGKGFYLFGQAGANYNAYKQQAKFETPGFFTTTKTNAFSLSAYPGITYTVSKNFHLEIGLNNLVSLGYTNTTTTNAGISGSRKQNDFSFGTNLSSSNPFSIGFRFALGK
jgi:hypothetical protein